jgi:23S rRNA (guanosine2251-2'-O)-methyltransferase
VPGSWLWGRHAVLAALDNPERKILRLIAVDEAQADLAPRLEASGAPPARIVTKEEIARMLPPGAVHQGVALLTRALRPVAVEDVIDRAGGRDRAVVLVLDQVTDPHNIGAVLRSAAAFGALAVIVPERNSPEASGTMAKAASGGVEHVPLVRAINLARALRQLKDAGFWCVGLDGAADKTLAGLGLTGRICLVLGSEGDGMRRLTREVCDLQARLSTTGPITSLNVSNAAAIALYELSRA